MDAVFSGRNRNRVVVETQYGYLAAEAIDDCEFAVGEPVFGVERDHGTQYWRDAAGNVAEVYVEAYDATNAWVTGWINAG